MWGREEGFLAGLKGLIGFFLFGGGGVAGCLLACLREGAEAGWRWMSLSEPVKVR